MNNLVTALIANETCSDEAEAIIEIEQMQSDLDNGEDIHDLLLAYDLSLDDATTPGGALARSMC
jgi:hypothetical protein